MDFNDPKNIPSNVLARSGSHSLLLQNKAPGRDGFYEEFKHMPNRLSVYDRQRFTTEYGDTIANPENTYMPRVKTEKKNYYDPSLPGMTRCLDFTPSTDTGQSFLKSLHRMPNVKESNNIGYAPAYMQIQHLNDPNEHKKMQARQVEYDVMHSTYRSPSSRYKSV